MGWWGLGSNSALIRAGATLEDMNPLPDSLGVSILACPRVTQRDEARIIPGLSPDHGMGGCFLLPIDGLSPDGVP